MKKSWYTEEQIIGTLKRMEAGQKPKERRRCPIATVVDFVLVKVVWPENPIRRIPSSTKGYFSVRNFGT